MTTVPNASAEVTPAPVSAPEAKPATPPPQTNPLLDFVPAGLNSFEEWMATWNSTQVLAVKLGLLHALTSWQLRQKEVSFLLDIADGYSIESNFYTDDERRHGGDNRFAKSRRAIAEEAFRVLVLRFFKGNTRDAAPLWLWMLEDEAVFQKVLWFLRSDAGLGTRNYYSYASDEATKHQQEVFRTFILEFVHLGWDIGAVYRMSDHRPTDTTEKRIVASRPQFIEILFQMRELWWLNRKELDATCLDKLTEIALREDVSLPPERWGRSSEYRKPATLEGALLGGSIAAQLVLVHQTKEKESKRIRRLYDESAAEHRKQQQQQRLDEIESQKRELDRQKKDLVKGRR